MLHSPSTCLRVTAPLREACCLSGFRAGLADRRDVEVIVSASDLVCAGLVDEVVVDCRRLDSLIVLLEVLKVVCGTDLRLPDSNTNVLG